MTTETLSDSGLQPETERRGRSNEGELPAGLAVPSVRLPTDSIGTSSNVGFTADAAVFNRLVETWLRETRFLSAQDQIVLHPAYQQIIGMGKIAIPLILRRLQGSNEPWSWALSCITRVDPVPREHRGDLERVRECWLEWGRRWA